MNDNEISYKISMVAKLTGFKPELLRAWELRYDFLKPERGPGGQRLYSRQDLELLFHIKELLTRGHSISELSCWGKHRLVSREPVSSPATRLFHAVSNRTVEKPVADLLYQLVDKIIHGAMTCDQEQIQDSLHQAASVFSQQIVIHDIIRRSAIQIGVLWQRGECSVAGEHLCSALFSRHIESYLANRRDPLVKSRPKVICTCLPDEQHVLGSQLVACHLSNMGFNPITIHAGLPLSSLETAVQFIHPRLLCLSVTSNELLNHNKTALIDLTRRLAHNGLVILGGQGVRTDEEMTTLGLRLCPDGHPVTSCSDELFSSTVND